MKISTDVFRDDFTGHKGFGCFYATSKPCVNAVAFARRLSPVVQHKYILTRSTVYASQRELRYWQRWQAFLPSRSPFSTFFPIFPPSFFCPFCSGQKELESATKRANSNNEPRCVPSVAFLPRLRNGHHSEHAKTFLFSRHAGPFPRLAVLLGRVPFL